MASKNRSLYVLQYLWQKTDEDHPAATADILEGLAEHGITINRRTIATDIDQLQEFGFDIICAGSSPKRFFIGQRFLELPELKLLVDAVESSRFISKHKSRELIDKLYIMTSKHQAKDLNRHIYVDGHIKADNKLLYYSIDIIHKAISDERRIRFKYIEYTTEKKKVHKHNGFIYEFSPYALMWRNDYYYVLGYSEKHKRITKFRVDRIDKAEMTEIRAVKKPSGFDPAAYLKNIFSMYDGQIQTVRLRCDADMMKVILDRFGKEIHTATCGDKRFIAEVKVSVSPTFYGWLFGFCGKIQVISPETVRKDYIGHAKAVLKAESD